MSTYRRDQARGDQESKPPPRIAHDHAGVDEQFITTHEASAGSLTCFSRMLHGLSAQQMHATLLALKQQTKRLHLDDQIWMRRHEERIQMLGRIRAGQQPVGCGYTKPEQGSMSTEANVAVVSVDRPASVGDVVVEREHLNQALYRACVAQLSSHARRKKIFDMLSERGEVGSVSTDEARYRNCLETLIKRDEQHQKQIDAKLRDAVARRGQLIHSARALVHPIEVADEFPETDKGCFLVTPRGVDPFDLEEVDAWMKRGFERRQAAVRNPLVDFQISMSHGAEHDREWQRYVVRRICRAIGRDPDRHVFAAAHEPDRHPPSKKDGKPVHPHAHVAVLTCNEDGSVWQVRNLHLVVQRELEAINHERGWYQLTTSAVAKGRQDWWYTPAGSATRIGWTTITRTARTFIATDSPACVRDVACEPVPEEGWRRPGAGLFVFNAQESPKRERLRRRDQRRFADAQATVDQLLTSCGHLGIVLPRDDRGRILLQYFSGASAPVSSVQVQLAHAVVKRDAAATAVLARRLLYFSE